MNYNKKYKCKCKTNKGTWCSREASYETNIRIMPCLINDNMNHLDYMEHYNNIIQLISIKSLGDLHGRTGVEHNKRFMIDIRLKMCGTHEKKLKKDLNNKSILFNNIYDYYRENGYIMRNGYVCKIKRGNIYR